MGWQDLIRVPRELTGSFFEAINPYLPMTYVIYGFREAISSSEGMSQYVLSVSILAICIFIFNVILMYVFKRDKESGIDIFPNTNNKIVMN
jgi:putative membrane protein